MAPVPKPNKILAVGLNYKEHRDEVKETAAKTIGQAQENIQTFSTNRIHLLLVQMMKYIDLGHQNFLIMKVN